MSVGVARRDRGLVVLGFPANEFGAQEPGTNAEIAQFCETRFGVTFPMFEKIAVKGAARRFAPTVAPNDPKLVGVIEAELAKV